MADAWNFIKRPFTEPKVTLSRDARKAGSRKGPNGTGLSREKRAKHLDDDELLEKHANAYSKAMNHTGAFYNSYNKTYTRANNILHKPHRGIPEEIKTGRTLLSAGEMVDRWDDSLHQHNRAYDYKRQLTARGLRPSVSEEKEWDSFSEGWNRKREPTIKAADKKLGNAQKIAKLAERLDKERKDHESEESNSYSEPHYTYTSSCDDDDDDY
ncbi:uncharacterized protein BDZ99DRAFT_570371 [Mytilinidion resinicola]|uniref:Uncharacterized protein n=1 Tax=Mytilinidion resinicola TaxID=574789 RepID=A0A6A6YRC7_9PEZI|nr:uncharacterized protein BDZ99DRAFT_570371 [Mytilinidion resinicola]KAF2811108.1 hypothetical protein BDZ99DRAFT_570371 [Mytilinidion resinicola]